MTDPYFDASAARPPAKKKIIHGWVGACWLALFALACPAFAFGEPPGVYVIFDGSGSMWGSLADGTRKIAAARTVLRDFASGDFTGRELALRAYGHRRKNDCADSELVIPFKAPETFALELDGFLSKVNPKGKTPITRSLRQALEDMGEREGEIILISDGIETCDEDPCALVRAWADKDIRIRVHVVGFGVDEKAKAALTCIAEAAGTTYRDAANADQLREGLADIHRETLWAMVRLDGRDPDGNQVPVAGVLYRDGQEVGKIDAGSGQTFEEGAYELLAGVPTRNGTLYRPIRKKVHIQGQGLTRIPVTAPLPPRVKAVFVENGETLRGALVRVVRDGSELFTFRHLDTVFMEPGHYQFHAKPNKENDLVVEADIGMGLNEVHFQMVKTVHVTFRLTASGSGIAFRGNFELWQNGSLRYKVHNRNGSTVLPGNYELRMPHKLSPINLPNQVINEEPEQTYHIVVPVGHVTVIYQDAEGNRVKDKRCFIGRGTNGKTHYANGGKKIPLRPGTYNVKGWRGNYDRQVFKIVESQNIEVVLREKP